MIQPYRVKYKIRTAMHSPAIILEDLQRTLPFLLSHVIYVVWLNPILNGRIVSGHQTHTSVDK